MTRRAVFAFLGTTIAAVFASFRPLSALHRRPPARGPCYRGSISWQPTPRTAAGQVRRGAADPTPLEALEVRDAPPGARLLLGRRTGAWSRNRPAGGRAPPRPHRRPGAHAPGSPVVRRRRAGRDRHLELGDLPGLDRPLARRAATPAGVGAASLPRRWPPLAPDLVAGYSAERPRTHAPQQKRGRSQGRHRPSPSSKSVHLAFPGGLDREHPFWGTRIGPQQIGDPRRITRPPPPGRPASARLRSA